MSNRQKLVSIVLLNVFLIELFAPLLGWALTSGPAQPEFANFEPLGTTGMVNEFNGQFTYNVPVVEIPGPNGSSYPLTLTYHSGASVEEDATWVGFGWSLNPGAIQRAVRGIPDDYNGEMESVTENGVTSMRKGDEILQINKQQQIETWVVGSRNALQAASTDLFSFDRANRYNTMTGFSSTSGFSISLGNFLAFSWRTQNGVTRFTANPNWMNVLQWAASSLVAAATAEEVKKQDEAADEAAVQPEVAAKQETPSAADGTDPQSPDPESPGMKVEFSSGGAVGALYSVVASYIGRSIGNYGMPAVTSPTETSTFIHNAGFTMDVPPIPVVVGLTGGTSGTISVHKNVSPELIRRAYGMLYADRQYAVVGTDIRIASESIGDASRDRESDFNGRDRFLSPTYGMYDQFTCSAHGISAVTRLIHARIGVHGPTLTESTGSTATLGFEAGAGPGKLSAGAQISIGGNQNKINMIPMRNKPSNKYSSFLPDLVANPNAAIGDRNGVFMRCMGDVADSSRYSKTFGPISPTIDQNVIGGVPSLVGIGYPQFTAGIFEYLNGNSASAVKPSRPRSSTNVSFRTNRELMQQYTGMPDSVMGWSCDSSITPRGQSTDKFIDRNEAAIRNRIGEIALTNVSGSMYVYGLPVYSRREKTITYAGRSVAQKSDYWRRLINQPFSNDDDQTQQYKMKPYATSFLLTEIYTPDYVDLGRRGPGSDDLGGYVSFRYKRAAGTTKKDRSSSDAQSAKLWYKWRTPYFGYSYGNEQISQQFDDRASVSAGEKELYYLNAIETKTHVAFFVTNTTNMTVTVGGQSRVIKGSGQERLDAYEALNLADSAFCEGIMGNFPKPGRDFATSLDQSTVSSAMGKSFGGLGLKGRENRQKVDPDWVKKQVRKNKSERLEKIVLIAKDANGQLQEIIQTVNFDYTYELMQKGATWKLDSRLYDKASDSWYDRPKSQWDTIYFNDALLNSAYYFTTDSIRTPHTQTSVNVGQRGKLTLKRMWVDYGDVQSPSISPYEFSYEYPRDGVSDFSWSDAVGSSSVWANARDFGVGYTKTSAMSGLSLQSTNDLSQNPAYDPVNADPWGSYWQDGVGRYSTFKHHIDQAVDPGKVDWRGIPFDPAAWQLKMVTLPSGAQLHIQYEANTYSYVQDKPALALIPLESATPSADKMECYIDVEKYLPGRDPKDVYRCLLDYLRITDRLYFKFLMPLASCGNVLPTTGKFQLGAEYLSGFAPVDSNRVSYDDNTKLIKIEFNGDPQPYTLMKEYLFNRQGSFPTCLGESGTPPKIPDLSKKSEDEPWNALISAGPAIAKRAKQIDDLYKDSDGGATPFLNFSYIRIPCVWKYGGGVRVKRIFLHDTGIEPGAGGLYGNEYFYDLEQDGVTFSSGVATNEPAAIREENPLFEFLQGKDAQSWYERITAGEEIDQYAGPIAENAYPGPSIGYSRVTTRSIASVPTAPGYTVSEFYTARDFPVVVEYTNIDKRTQFQPLLMTGFVNIQQDIVYAVQGFVVHTNGMHGRARSVTKYAGSLAGQTEVVESMVYEYYTPRERKPVLTSQDGTTFSVKQLYPGVEEELHSDARSYESNLETAAIQFDVGVQLPFVPIGHVGIPTVNLSKTLIQLATTTRILNHPAFVRSITGTRGSIRTVVQNVAFDPLTGEAAIVRSYDDQHGKGNGSSSNSGIQDGTINTVSVSAWQYYAGMGPKSINDMIGSGLLTGETITATAGTGTVALSGSGGLLPLQLRAGDVVYVREKTATTPKSNVYRVSATTGVTSATLIPGRGTKQNETPTGSVLVTVLRSGRANRLSDVAWSFRTHGTTLNEANVIPSTISNLLSASATKYADTWQEYPAMSTASNHNDWDMGRYLRWRPQSSYICRVDATELVTTTANRSYNTGRSSSAVPRFSYTSSNGSSWVRTSSMTKYNPHGDLVEEVDALGIPSTAVFGYQSSVPTIIAKNADAGTVEFVSFENGTSVSSVSHTGKQSAALNSSYTNYATARISNLVKSSGLLVRAWVQFRTVTAACSLRVGTSEYAMTLRPQVGGWHMAECLIPATDLSSVTDTVSAQQVAMKIAGNSGNAYVDDLRIQPLKSSATCYVYDPSTLRLVAQFDDRHYAALFKYDQEGRLTRKDRETTRGNYPLHEAHYNRPSVPYTPANSSNALMQRVPSRRTLQDRFGSAIAVPLSATPSKMGGSFDMLQIHIDPQHTRFKVIGKDTAKSVSNDSLLRLFNSGDRPK